MPYPKIYSIHPGEILQEEFLKPLKITQYRLAKDIGVPARRINEIVKGLRGISADSALRLAAYFKMTPEFWMSLQTCHDLYIAEQTSGKKIKTISISPAQAAHLKHSKVK